MKMNDDSYKSVSKNRHSNSSKDAMVIQKNTSEVNSINNSWSEKFSTKTLQDYEVLSVIGNGAFGTCYKVRDKESGELYAWKGMDYDELSDENKASLISEISVLRQLKHPNIVQYYHHLVNHEAKSIYIVMECCEGGDLAQLIAKTRIERKRFEEKYIWRILFQLCKALQVCHNKITQGTILHRDIKPANIFLDASGNAKLGDFGLARMLQRDQQFAATFVGTPYYMSPEIVKGSKYDRKSDVWAVGCLIYELCALRPPFKGRKFEQLSTNISNGKFSSIPEVYSSDLQEIISFMLEVDNDQRPGIEIIIRHPLVVRNIPTTDLGEGYTQLVCAEEDFYVPTTTEATQGRCKLDYSSLRSDTLSSTMYTEQYSFHEGYGQRCLSISGVFTPDLRSELFYSAKRRIFTGNMKSILLQSDPELYESIRRDEYACVDSNKNCKDSCLTNDGKTNDETKIKCSVTNVQAGESSKSLNDQNSPKLLTQNVFDHSLQTRLHAIRAQESLLKQRSADLDQREQRLNMQENRLIELERKLQEKAKALETVKLDKRSRQQLPNELAMQMAPPPPPPPVPPRKTIKHDDTYCSIEPNDSLQQPTVAKINLAALPAFKSFGTLRKVTFQSPQKFIKYDIENVPPMPSSVSVNTQQQQHQQQLHGTITSGNQMQMSVSSKGSSDDSAEGHAPSTTSRRKSILSLFGLSRSKDSASKPAIKLAVPVSVPKQSQPQPPVSTTNQQRQPLVTMPLPLSQPVLSKAIHSTELTNIWTREQKRAAFDLLAAMNAAKNQNQSTDHHKFRQSVRERTTLHRNRMRRSLVVGGRHQLQTLTARPDGQLLI